MVSCFQRIRHWLGPSTYLTPGSTGGDIGGGDDTYPIAATVENAKHGNGGTLNLRQSASSGTQLVTTIPNGAAIYVKSLTGEWLAAKYNTYTGYVMARYILGTSAYGESGGTTTPGNLTVEQYMANLEAFCNQGWKYGAGYKPKEADG